MIESYKTNAPMRETFYRMNGIKHIEIWDSENGYQAALCSDDGIGFRESPEFGTIGQCITWSRQFCPELNIHS